MSEKTILSFWASDYSSGSGHDSYGARCSTALGFYWLFNHLSYMDFPHSMHFPSTIIPVQLPSEHRTLFSKSKPLSSSTGSYTSDSSRLLPQFIQYLLSGGMSKLQWGHIFPGISWSQCGHFIFNQLLLEVIAWKDVICCLTLVLLHFGHLNFVFSYSLIVSCRVNFFLHFSQAKS